MIRHTACRLVESVPFCRLSWMERVSSRFRLTEFANSRVRPSSSEFGSSNSEVLIVTSRRVSLCDFSQVALIVFLGSRKFSSITQHLQALDSL